mgnify:CR=1 FL=1
MMFTVKFINIGRNKYSWEKHLDEINPEIIEHEIRKSGSLMSRNIEVVFQDFSKGMIFAGMYCVGRFEVIKAVEA